MVAILDFLPANPWEISSDPKKDLLKIFRQLLFTFLDFLLFVKQTSDMPIFS